MISTVQKMLHTIPFVKLAPELVLELDIDTTRLFEFVGAYRGANGVKTNAYISSILGSKDMEMQEFINLFVNEYKNTEHRIEAEFTSTMSWRALFYIDSAKTHSSTDHYPDLIVYVSHYNEADDFSVLVVGDPDFTMRWQDYFIKEFQSSVIKKLQTVTGVNQDGSIAATTTPIKPEGLRLANDSFYPFIEEGIDKLTNDFNESDNNLILLIGEWGTGKSTLIRSMIAKSPFEHYGLCYNAAALESNGIIPWLESFKEECLISIEDADIFIESRENNNKQMSGLLNVIDGVISHGRKLIISTNLSSVNKVDQALMRDGRAYKVIEFRKLTYEEANAARQSVGRPPLPDSLCDKSLTLSTALNYKAETYGKKPKSVMGFSN